MLGVGKYVWAAGALALLLGLLTLQTWRIDRLKNDIGNYKVAVASYKAAQKTWQAAVTLRDDKLREAAKQGGVDYAGTEKYWQGQCLSAFRAGRASASCPASGGVPAPSLRSVWSDGAFTSGSVSP